MNGGDKPRKEDVMSHAEHKDRNEGRLTETIGMLGEMPVIVSVDEFSSMSGFSKRYVQTLCQKGIIPAIQTKRGGRYRIPTRAALAALGLTEGGEE